MMSWLVVDLRSFLVRLGSVFAGPDLLFVAESKSLSMLESE